MGIGPIIQRIVLNWLRMVLKLRVVLINTRMVLSWVRVVLLLRTSMGIVPCMLRLVLIWPILVEIVSIVGMVPFIGMVS